MGIGQADRAVLAGAGGGEPAGEVHVLADLQVVGHQGGAGIVTQARPGAVEVAADVGIGQADRAVLAGAGGGEPAEEHGLVDPQVVGHQGGAGIVTQARPGAVEPAADVGAEQADGAALTVADDRCPAQVQHTAGDPGGVHRWFSGVLEPASDQADEGHAGGPGGDAFLQEAIGQLEVDIRDQVFQVKPTRDPGSPKPQPMWIGVDREPPTQDVPDHYSPEGPGITPVPHRGFVNRLIIGGQVKLFAPADVIDQRLLRWGQSLEGRLSDHRGTLINAA